MKPNTDNTHFVFNGFEDLSLARKLTKSNGNHNNANAERGRKMQRERARLREREKDRERRREKCIEQLVIGSFVCILVSQRFMLNCSVTIILFECIYRYFVTTWAPVLFYLFFCRVHFSCFFLVSLSSVRSSCYRILLLRQKECSIFSLWA